MNRKHSVSFAIPLVCVVLQSANALTIYRIGGASLPAPDIPVAYEFVQVDWVSADPTLHGQLRQLEVANGSIAPVRLNPNVNLTPLIESEFGGQIQILEWAGWKKREEETPLFSMGILKLRIGRWSLRARLWAGAAGKILAFRSWWTVFKIESASSRENLKLIALLKVSNWH